MDMGKIDHLKKFIIVFLILKGLYSQGTPDYEFQNYNTPNGLSNSLVHCIITDDEGYLWIGTENGLNKFDGYEFSVFSQGQAIDGCIYDENITFLFKDLRGNIWMRHNGVGLTRFNTKEEKFYCYIHNPNDPTSISSNNYAILDYENLNNGMCLDRRGNLWIRTSNGISRYNYHNDSFENFYLFNENDGSVYCISESSDDHLLIGTSNGAYRVNTINGHITRLPFEELVLNENLRDSKVSQIFEDSKKNIWIGTSHAGLLRMYKTKNGEYRLNQFLVDSLTYKLNRKSTIYCLFETKDSHIWAGGDRGLYELMEQGNDNYEINHYYNKEFKPEANENRILVMYEDVRGNVWAGGSFQSGIWIHDAEHKEFKIIRGQGGLDSKLAVNSISSISGNENGNVFLGAIKGGFYIADQFAKPFHHISPASIDERTTESNHVYSILLQGKDLLIGTADGLCILNTTTNKRRFIRQNSNNPTYGLLGNIVGAIHADASGLIWLGYFDHKISKYYPESGKFKHFYHDATNPQSFKDWSLRDIYQDSEKNMWFGACKNGLIQQKQGESEFVEYDGKDHFLVGSIIYNIDEDYKGNIWICTSSEGLCKFDPNTLEYIQYKNDPSDPYSISSNHVKTFEILNDSIIWIGTNDGGIDRFNINADKFERFYLPDDLEKQSIYGLLIDDSERLWMSTSQGIVAFDPKKETFRFYNVWDGIHNVEFNEGAYFKDEDGAMFFGGTNGITWFYPDQIVDNPYLAIPIITKFFVDRKEISTGMVINGQEVLSSSINSTREIVLEPSNNSFSLRFAAIHYAAPNNNQFKYMLEGVDKTWIYANYTDRTAHYTKLAPGQYNFKVLASNNDGIWNDNPAEILITVKPYWWESNIFRMVLVILFFGLLYVILKARDQRMRATQERLEKIVKERTKNLEVAKEEVDQQNKNISLLANIGQKITSSIRPTLIIENVYKVLNELMDAPSFTIGLINQENHMVEFSGYLEHGGNMEHLEISMDHDERLSIWCIRNNEIVFINNVKEESEKYFNKKVSGYTTGAGSSIFHLPAIA